MMPSSSSSTWRRVTWILRLGAFGMLVAFPAVARLPHAPDDQYEGFDKDSTTIIDRQTKLTWERDIRLTATDYNGANNYCTLTWNAPGARLPTIKELLTIFDELPHVEYNGANVNVHVDVDAFGANRTPINLPYWSSTPVVDSTGKFTGRVWAIDFGTGQMVERTKSEQAYYRCVKG